MSSEQVAETTVQPATCMESVNRISKLPVVEQTIQTAQNIYGKVKEYNSVTNWTLQTAENTAYKAVEVAKPYATPVIKNFEGPIKKVDDVLCSGLDYVESKVPAVKLPPKDLILQMYNNTKEYYNSHVTPAVETAMSYAEPAVKTARDVGEAAVEKARHIVEPMVEPIMENVKPIVDNVKHRVDEYLQRNEEQPEGQHVPQQSEEHNGSE